MVDSVDLKMEKAESNEEDETLATSSGRDNVEAKDIDYTTMPFDDLLLFVKVKYLECVFKKIHNFLESPEDELEFPGILKPCEEILLRIIKNVNVLKTQRLVGGCNYFGKKILGTLKSGASHQKYIVVCVYKSEPQDTSDDGVVLECDNILVYKKVFYAQKMTRSYASKRPLPSTPLSCSTSTDSIDSQNPKRSNVTNSFITHCLYRILQFVKDDTQLNLEFTSLNTKDAEYLFNFFSSVIYNNYNKGLYEQNICTAIWEAVQLFSLKYRFCVQCVDSEGDTKSLLLEKNTKSDGHDNSELDKKEMKNLIPKENKVNRKKGLANIIKELPEVFKVHSLKKIVTFLSDETEASVIFFTTDLMEKKFLKNILQICHSENLKLGFDEKCKKLLDVIKDLERNRQGYNIVIRHNIRDCGKREIQYYKRPKYGVKPAKVSRPWYLPVEKPYEPTPSTSKYKSLRRYLPTQRFTANIGWPAYSAGFSAFLQNSITAETSSPNIQSAGVKQKETDNNILESEKDSLLIEVMKKHEAEMIPLSLFPTGKAEPKPVPKVTKSNLHYGVKAKQQLLEALSVPVQSEKAIRMMRSMGWKGGALGSRENGITEPIMPQITVASGAGLGHSKTQLITNVRSLPKPPPGAPIPCAPIKGSGKFKQEFLQQILDLVLSNHDKKTVCIHPKMKKKERGFLKHMLKAFSCRQKITLEPDLQCIVDEIAAEFAKDPELLVTACISDAGHEIILTKLHNHIQLLSQKDKKKLNNEDIMEEFTGNIPLLLDSFGTLYHTKRTLDKVKLRVEVLVNLLDFVKNHELNNITVNLFSVLSYKQRRFVTSITESINKKEKFGASAVETAISMEFQKYMGNYQLTVKHGTNFFTVTKVYPGDTGESASSSDGIEHNNNVLKENEFVKKVELAKHDNYKYRFIKEVTTDGINDNELMEAGVPVHSIADDNDEKTVASDDISSHGVDPIENDDNKGENENKTNIDDEKNESPCNESDKLLKAININAILENIESPSKKDVCDEEMTNSGENCDTNDKKTKNSNYMIEDISMSSAYTINLDYSETDADDISMDIGDTSDEWNDERPNAPKTGDTKSGDIKINEEVIELSDDQDDNLLELSLKSDSIDSVEKESQIETPEKDVTIHYLTKDFFLNKEMPKYIQGLISLNIVQTKQLPLLKCHGVYNGALIYSCHTKKSNEWLNKICVANNININTKEFDKMSLRVNSFFEFDDKYFFNMLELYNHDISTNKWIVLKKDVFEDCVLFEVKMDKKSFQFILDSNLELFAGVDKVTFSIVWK